MPKLRLTDAAVQRLRAPPGQRVEYFDVILPSFVLRVSGPTPRNPSGSKSWGLYYRVRGQLKRLTLEPGYPAQSLAEARQRARDAFEAIERGLDPTSGKRAAQAEEASREADTIENVIPVFMQRHMIGKERSSHYVGETRSIFDRHVLPYWRGRLIGDIKRRDVIECLDRVLDLGQATAGQGRKQGGPASAIRVLAALSKLFNWSIQRGLIEHSPCRLIEPPGIMRPRTRVLSDREICLVWRGSEQLPYPQRQFFRLLLVTGQRREETATIRWKDIDEGEAVWTIPAANTKAHRANVVPLTRLALAILAECPQGPNFVFSTRRQCRRPGEGEPGEASLSGYTKAKVALDAVIARLAAESGEPPLEPWVIHDLRRSVVTHMARLGVARFVVERVINHAEHGAITAYDHWGYLPQKREALSLWADHISSLVTPPPPLRVVGGRS